MHPRPWGALSPEADAPDLHCVVAVFSQAPEGTGPSGGVHLPDHTLSRAILSLQEDHEKEKGSLTPVPGHRLNPNNLNIQALQRTGVKRAAEARGHQLPDSLIARRKVARGGGGEGRWEVTKGMFRDPRTQVGEQKVIHTCWEME